MHRIEICGGIASGKTTLATLLATTGANPVLHSYESNPFFIDFCTNSSEFGFESEITFLLQHFNNLKKHRDYRGWCVFDTSLVLHLSYANTNLSLTDLRHYETLFTEIARRCSLPDILIVLKCSEIEQQRRIKSRARSLEQDLPTAYLESVNENIARFTTKPSQGKKVIILDSENFDYADNPDCQRVIASAIKQMMAGGTFG